MAPRVRPCVCVVSLVIEEHSELRAVGRKQLEPVVRQALRSSARLRDWEWRILPYHSVLPGRTLARFSGWALDERDQAVPWSSVLKVFGHEALDQRGVDITTGKREILAYRSSLLADLPGPLRAPRVLGIDENEEGAVWLWLEDLKDMYARRWPLEQFGVAARHLGAFNGAYLVSRALPTDPWLNPWLNRHRAGVEHVPGFLPELQRVTQLPPVQRLFGATIAARAAHLLQDQGLFMQMLSQLPQTLCHHESSLANLFATRRSDGELETVAVDWEQVGPGPVGADIATLVFGTMRRCEFDAEQALELDRVVFAGYVAGLRDAEWDGDVEQVRMGYTAAIAGRWSVLATALRELADGAPQVQHPSQGWQLTPDTAIRQWVRLIEFLLDRADEARHLALGSSAR